MMIILQLVLYCLLFTAMVKYAVRSGAINGLYFYPKKVQEKAIAIGLITRDSMIWKQMYLENDSAGANDGRCMR